MEYPLDIVMQFWADMLLPFIRISSMLMVMAAMGAKTIPSRVKIMLAVFITLAVLPMMPSSSGINLLSFNVYLLVMQQMLVGITLGFVTMMFLASFTLAGQVLAMQAGLGFASSVDPANGLSVAVVGQFYLMLASLFFWLFDGHFIFLQFLMISFQTFPIDGGWMPVTNLQLVVEWGSWMFAMALSLVLAPLTAMLLINFSFGIMTRAAPQLNIFSIGFPVTMTSGMIIIWLTVGNVMLHFEEQFERLQILACELVRCT